jgi:Cell Wall Hydrolase
VALRTRLTGAFAVPFWLSGGCAVIALMLIGHQEPLAQGAPPNADSGEVHTKSFKTPAERLGLSGKPRARAEACLANAIYFESRGEPLRGQKAVAQVVMNRVFSGRYPHDICGVVFQNASHYLACQFTFACTGRRLNHGNEPRMWQRANRVARDILDGKIWLKEVGHATHYHASWVRPLWIREMAKLYRFGVHTFYRPRAWGDGSNMPALSDVSLETKTAVAATSKSATGNESKITGASDHKSTGLAESKPKGAPETKSSTASTESKSTNAADSKTKGAAESKSTANADSKSKVAAAPKATGAPELKSKNATESKPEDPSAPKP